MRPGTLHPHPTPGTAGWGSGIQGMDEEGTDSLCLYGFLQGEGEWVDLPRVGDGQAPLGDGEGEDASTSQNTCPFHPQRFRE